MVTIPYQLTPLRMDVVYTYCFLLLSVYSGLTAGLHPVILAPGDGGNQLDAKLNKTSSVHFFCEKTSSDYFNIWLNLELLAPEVIDCWVDNVRLVYNATTRTTTDSPGVQIRVPGFGNTSTVENLDASGISTGNYFKKIVESSLLPLGYVRNVNIFGAPYDFRKAPNELHDWFVNYKALIETAYVNHGNKSVILICHSMGSPLSLLLLNNQTRSWRDKYIRALITLGGPWGGTMKAVKAFASGDDLGAYLLPGMKLRGVQRTSPSLAFLLPNRYFWNDTEVIASIQNKRNYTINDLKYFFNDMNWNVGYEMYKDSKDIMGKVEDPLVEVHCLYGTGVATVERLNYKDTKHFPDKPSLDVGDGDGTVNVRSLRGCLRWRDSRQRNPAFLSPKKRAKLQRGTDSVNSRVYNQEYPGVEHLAILNDPKAIAYIKGAVQKMNEI